MRLLPIDESNGAIEELVLGSSKIYGFGANHEVLRGFWSHSSSGT